MLIVVAILGLAAALAIPQASSIAPQVVDAAAAEVARAVRFAQREAIRTGTFHRISVDPAGQTLRVYRPNSSTGVTTVHPVDKRPYELNFRKDGMARATIVSSVFTYEDRAVTNHVTFGPDGAPGDPAAGTPLDLLGQLFGAKEFSPLKGEGRITLRYGPIERVVRVAPVTGRVSL